MFFINLKLCHYLDVIFLQLDLRVQNNPNYIHNSFYKI